MANDYREALRILSERLLAHARTPLGHPTGKGDHREQLVLDFLNERIGSAFAATKAEVIDSKGRTTGEFDAVIYDQQVGSCVAADAGRKVIRVESVAATVEVKTTLKANEIEDYFKHSSKELLQLTRFYGPTELLRMITTRGMNEDRTKQTQRVLDEGLNAMMHHESIPDIVGFFFGFDGPTKEAAANLIWLPGIDVICVPGKYTLAKGNIGFPSNPAATELWSEGPDALGAFVFLLEQCLNNYLEAKKYVAPQWRRYFLTPRVMASPNAATDDPT